MEITTTKNGIQMAVFPSFQEAGGVSCGVSVRAGGVSAGCWASLNLGFGRGDGEQAVFENFRRFTAELGVKPEDTVFFGQTHSSRLRRVHASDRGKGIKPSGDRGVDGMYTNEPNVGLVTFFADCVPLLFFDPVKKAIAASHSGWRGTVSQIGRLTVEALVREFGCDPKDILAGIGPSIGPCCFEVDGPVAGEFLKNPEWAGFVAGPYGAGKYKVDLWNVNKQILESSGIPSGNIDCGPLCTCCNEDLFYSHRRDGEKRGSMAAVICLSM